jgi:hypothetical protein
MCAKHGPLAHVSINNPTSGWQLQQDHQVKIPPKGLSKKVLSVRTGLQACLQVLLNRPGFVKSG